MPNANSPVAQLDQGSRTALSYWIDLMDGFTGGAFKRGTRDATPPERVREWDSLTPEQFSTLRDRMGEEWLLKQGAEIEKLRAQLGVA